MKEKYESLSLAVLKDLAKARGMKGLSGMKKSEVIEAMLRQDASEKGTGEEKRAEAAGETVGETAPEAETEQGKSQETDAAGHRPGRQSQNDGNAQRNRMKRRNGPEYMNRTADSGSEARLQGNETRQQGRSENGYRNPMRSDGEYRNPPRSDGEYRTQRTNMRTGGRKEYGQAYPSYRRDNAEFGGQGQSQNGTYQRSSAPAQNDQQSMNASYPGTQQNGGTWYQNGPQGTGSTGYAASAGSAGNAENTENELRSDQPPVDLAQLDSGQQASGILEVMADGFGFIRSDNYLPGENDVYVSPSQIRRFNLKTGDIISGNTRIKTMQEKFSALLYLKTINGRTPAEAAKRYNFEDMTPIFPNERLCMERGSHAVAMRIVDLLSPIGKGQRGMIVSPPKAGKTTLLKDVARSIQQNDPDMKLIILLIDERPEEVTDIKEAIQGENVEVIYSTFDELPDHHKRVSEMVIERAKRLVEHQENVTILLDSITRLARAYNLTVPPSGRTLSGGLDPAALHMPKRFFGAARNMREGGSLTILATALVDTGSKMDDVVYEEFKGTGNMELVLDRKLSEKRVFPAIDIQKSGTRREDLLLDREEQEAVYIMRRALNGMKSDEAVENILNTFVHTKDNRELVQRVRRQKYV